MEENTQNAMITCDDSCNELCNERVNSHSTCNDSRLSKSDWWYLVQTLEGWGVFKPRAIIKKAPAVAWKVMCLCKDANVIKPGSYFTACYRNELAKMQARSFVDNLEKKLLRA